MNDSTQANSQLDRPGCWPISPDHSKSDMSPDSGGSLLLLTAVASTVHIHKEAHAHMHTCTHIHRRFDDRNIRSLHKMVSYHMREGRGINGGNRWASVCLRYTETMQAVDHRLIHCRTDSRFTRCCKLTARRGTQLVIKKRLATQNSHKCFSKVNKQTKSGAIHAIHGKGPLTEKRQTDRSHTAHRAKEGTAQPSVALLSSP